MQKESDEIPALVKEFNEIVKLLCLTQFKLNLFKPVNKVRVHIKLKVRLFVSTKYFIIVSAFHTYFALHFWHKKVLTIYFHLNSCFFLIIKTYTSFNILLKFFVRYKAKCLSNTARALIVWQTICSILKVK